MPKYLVMWRANPAVWPTDPKQLLAILEGALAGGDELLKMDSLKELGWFTDQAGYAVFEVDSKEKVLGMIQPFFPYYSPDIHEIVPWDKGKDALLESARRAASR